MSETIIVKLARQCAAAVGGTKGRKREEAVINFWNGAIMALDAVSHEDAQWVGRVGHLLIASRGYSEVEAIIRKADEAKAAAKKGGGQ